MAGVQGTVVDSIVVAQAKAAGPREAAEDIVRQFASCELAMVVVFVSPFYDPGSFIREITQRMPDTPVFGCTTAGELATHGWEEDSVVALGFDAEDFIISACALPDLSSFRIDRGRALCEGLYREFAKRTGHCDARYDCFGLLFIDGMCQREEAVMSAVYGSLVVGGSAGDGLRFERSWVFFERTCRNCHSTEIGVNKVGPSLWNIIGRIPANVPDFAYSDAMKANKDAWNEATLDAYLADPRGDIHGVKMFFKGLPDQSDRADVIAYLQTLR